MLGTRIATGRRVFQPLWERLHELSLRGMNVGTGDAVRASGELLVLDAVAKHVRGRPPVVFDVGANVGAYASLVLERLPDAELYCFEPSPTAFARLVDAVGDCERAHLFDFGLGADDGFVPLYADADGSPLSSVFQRRLDHLAIPMNFHGEVRLRRLDAVCLEEGIDHVDLLKLDVEGNELNVLEGAGALLDGETIDAVQFEFGGTNIDARTYFQDFFYLLNPSYRLYRIVADGLAAIERYRERYEIFETTNFLALSRLALRV